MTRKGLVAVALLLFMVAIIAVNAITLTFTAHNEQAVHALLLNGKTSSAISAKKTAVIAQDIENLIVAYHKVTQEQSAAAVTAAAQAKAAATKGTKELPSLLKQIETAIAAQDNQSIQTAVKDATANVEQYFTTHQ